MSKNKSESLSVEAYVRQPNYKRVTGSRLIALNIKHPRPALYLD